MRLRKLCRLVEVAKGCVGLLGVCGYAGLETVVEDGAAEDVVDCG